MTMNICLLAMDLDGTLGGTDEQCQPLLAAMAERGAKLALVTARGVKDPKVYQVGDYYRLDYLVLENGSAILSRQQDRFALLPSWDEQIAEKLAGARAFRDVLHGDCELIEAKDRPEIGAADRWFYHARSGLRFRAHEQARITHLESEDEQSYARLRTLVEDLIAKHELQVTVMDNTDRSLCVGAASKGEAVSFIADILGCPRDQICAIGDALNDLPLLAAAGLPCAPANAFPPVKDLLLKRGGILAQSKCGEGVAEILAQLLDHTTPGGTS